MSFSIKILENLGCSRGGLWVRIFWMYYIFGLELVFGDNMVRNILLWLCFLLFLYLVI